MALDVEDGTILSSIFKDSFPEIWRENPDFVQYLTELSSFGVDKLCHEPERLAEERAQILEQTQELAFHNYKTFIETADCSKEIVEDFNLVEQHVNNLLNKLPEFSDKCQIFMKNANEINVSRRLNTLTLNKHTQLLEVLEIPQLMDTCVRNSYYEEALELSAYVKRLDKKHSSIAVIQDIVNKVKNSMQLMLNQLIQQLRTSVQLPACLRVIGYLRRMDVFSESELRIKFLQARDAWFQGILSSISTDDAYIHITKIIELSRVHLFDIITQYRAIFSDDDPILSSSQESSTNESSIFHGWVVHKVSNFLQMLEFDLNQGVGNRLDSLLGQCMYFGLSFSRVGADFRGLLSPLFQRAALRTFCNAAQEATERFCDVMQSYTLIASPALISATTLSSVTLQGDKNMTPPANLLEYPPLAVYTNNILSAFNDLRHCSPIALAPDVARQLQLSLECVMETIVAYFRAEETTFNDQQMVLFLKLCRIASEEMVPFLNRCLQLLFPASSIAQTLGVTVHDLSKMGGIGVMNIAVVVQKINQLLPTHSQQIEDTEEGKELEDIETTKQLDQENQAESNPLPSDHITISHNTSTTEADQGEQARAFIT
ncbi:conserved oligomeric Golgi complex subunit 8-like [Anneissia japonica]|uniref:conserved oligomeric Golgi complex subunit 8-like n=1 Tax=Anneissia japonica TaxID=1529436 RepID=UPI0014259D03|nr:conserved oligomeric Golgi complex subunit 8-like [Anneissia japonica]